MANASVLATGVNLVWLLVASFLIFFMKAGFAMLEAGQVRAKNVANQLTQTMVTLIVGILAYFAVGAALSSLVSGTTGDGASTVVGAFAHVFHPGDVNAWAFWLFGAMFAIAAANIVSGGVAGRCKPRMYAVYTLVVAGLVYPIVAGVVWNGGPLAALGFKDFAGGAAVHALGGLSGLTAAYVLGPRIDRYRDDGTPNVVPGHSITLAVLGTLILCFGWYGFNVGTAVTVFNGDGTKLLDFAYIGRVVITTTLGMVAGGAGAGLVSWHRTGNLDTLELANGLLAGLVGVTGAANLLSWPGALVIGLLAGAQLPLVFEFVERRLKIDDVCAVFPVHGTAGMLGIVLYPLFSVNGFSFGQEAIQILGVVVIGVWSVGVTYLLFRVATSRGWARIDVAGEREGLDISVHGVETYPEFQQHDRLTDSSVRTDGGAFRSQRSDGDDERSKR